MSQRSDWVDRIFERLTVRYGAPFLNKWQGIDLAVVKADWAHELDGFEPHESAIRYALDHLPERPPNVVEFRAIARRAPAADVPRLEAPKANPARVAEELKKLQPARTSTGRPSAGTDWASAIVARAAAGDVSRSNLPLRWAREALAREGGA